MAIAPLCAPLPMTVDVIKLASQGSALSGQFATKHLPRLGEAVLELGETLRADLQFFVGDEGFIEVAGTVSGEVGLTCQRCLGVLRRTLSSEFALAVVHDEADVANVPKRLDPWLIDAGTGDLRALLEDELLLTLPIVALHERGQCEAVPTFAADDRSEKGTDTRPSNPFQILERLKLEK